MFLRSQLSWNVVIPAQNLDAEGLILQKAILIGLLEEFAAKKASKDIGYFLALHHLQDVPGEILEGVVHKILKHGVFVKCGPAEKVYISHLKMADYQYMPGENPCFRNDKSSKIEKGTVVRFLVLAEKYDEAEKDFRAVVSLEGDYLGPIN
ncbi:UNVERIFIED_CONTAM: DNA-directed RNA polymerase V subunit [Sesamum latifolium]|uniref:DNA-directed RNA polymerase subunit n=1 Tax=Sesamum latifolium TaxID=2727402 RepID=A0AAW2XTK2_9LAMI